jgi:hypothetical protein
LIRGMDALSATERQLLMRERERVNLSVVEAGRPGEMTI